MTLAIRNCAAALALLCISTAIPASAQVQLATATPLPHVPRYDVAFDRVNQVYVLISDESPVSGRFLTAGGAPIGSPFAIAGGGPYTSWATVSFGGSPQDPVFLVTYLAAEGANVVRKYGRTVRYQGAAAPLVSPQFLIADVNSEWYAADRARTAWDGQQFVVSTRVFPAGSAFPMPQVHRVDVNGTVTGGVLLGDYLDYEGGPSVACSPSQICMLTGFASGTPFGSKGGVYARLFNSATLQPLGAVFYLDDHSTFMDNPNVVFNAKIGKFVAVWYRRTGSYIDSRVISLDGQMAPLDMSKSFGPGAGDISLSYNPVSQTALLVTKWSAANNGADLYGVELGDEGWVVPGTSPVRIAAWDQKWPEYRTTVAASDAAPQWMVTYTLAANSWAAVVQTAGSGGPPPPPPGPSSSPAIIIDAPTAGTVQSRFTISGWAVDRGAGSGSGIDAVHVWAYPSGGGGPIFIGAAGYGLMRGDVGAVFGGQFSPSGYALDVAGLWPGTYDLVAWAHSTVTGGFVVNKTVRINVAGQLVIDSPGNMQSVGTYFTVSGWAFDGKGPAGVGIDAVHVWAYPNPGSGAAPIFLGAAGTGWARPDVGAAFGSRFTNSGYILGVWGLQSGLTYDLVVFAHSSVTGTFVDRRVSRVRVSTFVTIDHLTQGQVVAGNPVTIQGWAVDDGASTGTGVDAVHIWAYPNPGSGAPPILLGVAQYGFYRPDIGDVFGSRFTNSGYSLSVNLPPGTYDVVAFARSTVDGTFRGARIVQIVHP